MTLLTAGFADTILLNPLALDCDALYILTAHATPEMVSWTIKTFTETVHRPVTVCLLIGMAAEGISERAHTEFCRLHGRRYGNVSFECSYIERLPYCHTNIYVWKKESTPVVAYTGSAEFAQSSFLFPVNKEVMSVCDPMEAVTYVNVEIGRSIYCNHNDVLESIRILSKHALFDADIQTNSTNKAVISLLSNKGVVATRSGLNWGQRQGRNPNQAYIRLPSRISQTGFFPLDRQFTVTTDDGKTMNLRVEQAGNKAITTPDSNALIGEYFRNRLGVPNGGLITVEHLINYGRTNVAFIRIDEETFYMDFSQPLR